MRFQIERAESFYENRRRSRRACADCRPTLSAMTEIYHRLLRAVAASPGAGAAPPRVALDVVEAADRLAGGAVGAGRAEPRPAGAPRGRRRGSGGAGAP
jgi:hypothetical protein